MSTRVTTSTNKLQKLAVNSEKDQYTLWQILGLWVAVSAPMGILTWIVFPILKDRVSLHPGIFLWVLMIIGLMWQVFLSLAILYRETGTLNLGSIRHRTWRQKPRHPKTGRPNGRLWLWLIPIIILTAVIEFTVSPLLTDTWTTVFPFFTEPPGYSQQSLMDTPELWVGAWYLLVLWSFQFVGNYLLGEEFFWRSVLLPKMQGVFGKWDWLANALFFGAAHWGKPWHIPSGIVSGILYAYPSKRFRSAWFGLIVHGADGLFILFLILGLVLGKV
jgi:membrane protease YdiL (CAAX protease family)